MKQDLNLNFEELTQFAAQFPVQDINEMTDREAQQALAIARVQANCAGCAKKSTVPMQ